MKLLLVFLTLATTALAIDRICLLKKDIGECHQHLSRWYYEPLTNRCEEFVYRGCGGNRNNFKSKLLCERQCDDGPADPHPSHPRRDPPLTLPVNTCKLPKVPGPCKGSFLRWWFNFQTMECEKFIYGGCGGNANRFKSEKECLKTCKKGHITLPFPKKKICGKDNDACKVTGEFASLHASQPLRRPSKKGVFFPPCCPDFVCCICDNPVFHENGVSFAFGNCQKFECDCK